MIRVELPEAVARRFAEAGADGCCAFSTCGDLALAGGPGRRWLALHGKTVYLADDDGPARALAFEDVQGFRALGGAGNGCLQARTDGAWIDLVRYSNTLSFRFAKAAAKLEDCRKSADGAFALTPEDERDDRKCPKCNTALTSAGDVCPACVPKRATLQRALALLKPHRRGSATLTALVLLGVLIELLPPILQQKLVDDVLQVDKAKSVPQALVGVLGAIVASLAAVRAVGAAIGYFKGRVAVAVGTALTLDLRGKLVRKLHGLSVGYYDKHQVSSLMNRVAYDTESLHSLVSHLTGGFVLQILQVLGVGAMLFWLNPKLALLTLIPAPFVVGGSIVFWKYVFPLYYRYWDSASKQASALSGMLSGIRVVKAFHQEERELGRYDAQSQRLRNTRVDVESSAALFSAAMAVVFSLGGLIVWYVGGRDVLGGSMTLGSLMAFLAYLGIFYAPLANLAQLTSWFGGFMTASQRVFELLDTVEDVRDRPDPQRLPRLRGAISFRDVVFGYDRHRPVLKGVTLDIQPGEFVGVVGRSGSGKTTLVNLVCRFYDADSGQVLIDGVDVKDIAQEDLSRQIGVVLQEPFLFRGPIWRNLAYGQPDATPEQLLAAARAANAHDFILRQGLAYETMVGERGAGLSGGERQRLSIARAMLYDPRMLILDEATSSVDTESEKQIQDALAAFVRGRTTIAIAHRLSTLRNADRILVFDNGKLAESGSHKALVRRGGIYANLVRIQTRLGGEDDLEKVLAAEQRLGTAVAELPPDGPPEDDEPPRDFAAEPQSVPADFWLDPAAAEFDEDPFGGLRLTLPDGTVHDGAFAVRAFPATHPDKYLSLRVADADGKEADLGMVRDLAAWPAATRALLDAALAKRYCTRVIRKIVGLQEKNHWIWFDVETDRGRERFLHRWSQNTALDYGARGKLILDVDDNHWIVPDENALPPATKTLFKRYIYW